MPHLIVEYSSNLEILINIPGLVRKVHEAALATGVFQLSAVRTRAERRDRYIIADGHPDNSFVAVFVRIAPGRDAETRHRLGSAIFDALCNHLQRIAQARPMLISLEVQEVDPVAAFRKSNLDSFVKEHASKSPP